MTKPVGPYTPVVEAGEWLVVSGQVGRRQGVAVAQRHDLQVRAVEAQALRAVLAEDERLAVFQVEQAVVLDRLTVQQLAAAAARLSVFVSNDTGPMHIAAAVGTPVVILMQHHPMFNCYIPPGERHRVVAATAIEAITVELAYTAARAAFTTERASSLFSG